MLVTPEGIVMLVNPVQPEKVPSSMLVTPEGIVMLVNPVQPEKAYDPILVTLEGIVMLVFPPGQVIKVVSDLLSKTPSTEA
jgi:hypothetical protein